MMAARPHQLSEAAGNTSRALTAYINDGSSIDSPLPWLKPANSSECGDKRAPPHVEQIARSRVLSPQINGLIIDLSWITRMAGYST